MELYDPMLCCLYSIPPMEQRTRLESIQIHMNTLPLHKNNPNFLNQKKDVVIQTMFQSREWNSKKKQVNLFEKVNSYPSGIVAKNAYSRAYFKMMELSQYMMDYVSVEMPMRCLCLAEAPGGFLQALQDVRDRVMKNKLGWSDFDYYVGTTLAPDGTNPDWEPELRCNHRVKLMYQDVLQFEPRKIPSNNLFHIVTGDCGIDFRDQFHDQEKNMYPLLLAQTEQMLRSIRTGGGFILKIFETDLYHTKELLYLIGCCFHTVIMVKPRTSRPLNAERYIVCRNCIIQKASERWKLADRIREYRLREHLQKGSLWKQYIPEECMYLFHGYSRYCKEITNRHLQLIIKKFGDDMVKLQHTVASKVCESLQLKSHP